MTQPTTFKPKIDEPVDSLTPLIHFKGIVKGYRAESREVEGRQNPSMSVSFDFTDLTVIEAREPYPFPIATIRIPYSERGDTRWAAFTNSLRKLIPMEVWKASDDPLSLMTGKMAEFHFKPAKLRLPVVDPETNEQTGAWALQDGEAWQIDSLEGFGGGNTASIMDLVLDYADGKKDSDIYQWVYTEQSLKALPSYQATVTAVSERKLLSSLVEAGKLTQDTEGIYHKS